MTDAGHTLRLAAIAATLAAGTAQAQEACPPGFKIALDVGHTLSQPGAISARGTPEFDYNRRLATAVDQRLRQRTVQTILIGQSGAPLTLTERTSIAARAGATVFLSLHHDSVKPQYLSIWQPTDRPLNYSDVFSGYSLFVSASNPAFQDSLRFAGLIGTEMRRSGQEPSMHHAEPIPGENRPLLDRSRGIYRFDALAVLRTARMPAVLLEAAIIVNRQDEEVVRSPAGLERTVSAVARAVLAYCALPR